MTDGPLSYGQRSLWFVQRLAPTATAYNISLTARTSGADAAALRDAWQALCDRHGALRTTYPAPGGNPVARVHPSLPVDFAVVDAADIAGLAPAALEERVAAEANRPFDLAQGPIVRLRLFETGGGESALLVGIHHIAVDFTSLAVLLDELATAYAARRRGEEPRLPSLPATYEDFARWQEGLLAGPQGEELLSYWRGRLAGAPSVLALPSDRPRPRLQSFRGGLQPVELGPELVRPLKALADAEGTTLSALILAAFQALLHRYSGQQDVLVGSPVPGRGPLPELRDVVGYFVNTVVLRADLAGAPTFRRFLARTKARVEEAQAHQDYPFPLLVERLRPDRDAAASPFFQVFYVLYGGNEERMMRLLTGQAGATLDLGDLTLRPYPLPGRAAMFDLSLLLCDAGDRVAGALQYGTDLFDPVTAEIIVADLAALLTAVAADPDLPVATLPASLGEAKKAAPRPVPATPAAGPPEREAVQDRAEARRALLERQKRLRRS